MIKLVRVKLFVSEVLFVQTYIIASSTLYRGLLAMSGPPGKYKRNCSSGAGFPDAWQLISI